MGRAVDTRGVQNRKNIIPVFTGISEKIPVRTGKYRYYRSNGIFFIPIPTLAVLPLVNGIHLYTAQKHSCDYSGGLVGTFTRMEITQLSKCNALFIHKT